MYTESFEKHEMLKIAILNNQLPRFTYKYRPINEFTEKIFENSEIWFSNPNTFNDPFDCQLIPQNQFERSHIETFLRKNLDGISEQTIQEISINFEKDPTPFIKIINDVIKNKAQNSGVSCFAGTNDNILMWSHYANSHNGICIKFDILKSLSLFITPFKVKYTNKYPIYNHLQNDENLLEFLFQTKAKCWEYENELRVIKPESKNYKFENDSLLEICFGCNVSTNDISKYQRLLKSKGFINIEFKKAIPSKSKFKLNIISL